VTAINAAIYLGELNPPVVDSPEYERLVDLVGARHGGAGGIDRAYKYLKIKKSILDFPKKKKLTWDALKVFIDEGRPIDISVWHNKTGYHSCLVIDYRTVRTSLLTKKVVTVLNFPSATKQAQILWKTLWGLMRDTRPPSIGYFYKDPLHHKPSYYKIENAESFSSDQDLLDAIS